MFIGQNKLSSQNTQTRSTGFESPWRYSDFSAKSSRKTKANGPPPMIPPTMCRQIAHVEHSKTSLTRPKCGVNPCPQIRREPISKSRTYSLAAALAAAITLITTSAIAHATTLHTVTSTSYCLIGTTASGATTRPGVAASNMHPLGTRIRLTRPAMGRRNWTIKDRIGHGSELDLWASSCGVALAWGRRTVTYRVIVGGR